MYMTINAAHIATHKLKKFHYNVEHILNQHQDIAPHTVQQFGH